MSWIRWSPPKRVVFGAVVLVAPIAVVGPVMPATRATDVAAVTVKTRALFTVGRKSPPGARDEGEWSFPAVGGTALAGQRSM
jgi:hypothetical protein